MDGGSKYPVYSNTHEGMRWYWRDTLRPTERVISSGPPIQMGG